MKTRRQGVPLTDARMDAALGAEQDGILPSSGFADAVMAAVEKEREAPAPIPFPWRRAMPGLVAGGVALVGFLAAVVYMLAGGAYATGTVTNTAGRWQGVATGLVSSLGRPDVLWVAVSLLAPLVCLVWLRRLMSAR